MDQKQVQLAAIIAIFSRQAALSGMYKEKSTISVINGATVPILQIVTSDDALFIPAPNPLPAPAASSGCRGMSLILMALKAQLQRFSQGPAPFKARPCRCRKESWYRMDRASTSMPAPARK